MFEKVREGYVLADAEGQDRALVLLAERGTFGSEPELGCPELAEVDAQFQLPAEEKALLELDATGRCHDRLLAEGVDLSAYDNPERAADVPAVLQAMGFTQWHLWGVSGGALLAQLLVRDHPQGIKSVMLDSGGFPTAHMAPVGLELLTNTGARFRRMFDECAADAACGAAHPDLETRLFALADALEATPRMVEVTHPFTGQTREVALDGDLLLQLYTNNMASVGLLPLVTDMAEAGDWSIVDSVLPAAFVTDTGTSFSTGLYNSVFCADLGDLSIDEVPTDGVPAALVHALRPKLETQLQACAAWQVDEVPEGALVGSDTIPALVMEGMYDTNRRPEAGAEVAARFQTAWLAEYQDRGHVVLDACAVDMMLAFMADPSVPPDMGCVPTAVDWY